MAKRPRSPSPAAFTKAVDDPSRVWISETIEDRSSIFVAYFSPTMPAKELQKHKDLKSASHRMFGYRRPSAQRTIGTNLPIMETGLDDDGEKYGGKRVLKVLEDMNAEGSLVVARWYGGVMLGPVRFTHIENCARDAVRAWKQGWETEVQKKRKVEEEEKEKEELVRDLLERDQSVRVLRGLLEQKSDPSASQKEQPVGVEMRDVDYKALSLERLRVMDKARDGTIAFLLKRIDAAEKQSAEPEVKPAPAEITKDGTKQDVTTKEDPTNTEQPNDTPD
ncbi:hypothetical protein H2203_002683 [Taxawa tesnikishii (nom. ined.)]|nr:hypothetical protein H2203_002683 [Dothideales sp. JES 119]